MICKKTLMIFATSSIALLLLSFSAFSQDINTEVSLKPVIVTATRSELSSKEVLADHTYIGKEDIEKSGQSSISNLLQQQRGIQISSFGGAGNVASVYLRGTGNGQSLIMIDGVKLDSSTGGALWNAIPLSIVDHIEIIYGPQSTFYGSDAMGGVIQIFTKRGTDTTHFEATGGYGSYNTTSSSTSLSGLLDKNSGTKYSIALSQENSSGFNTIASNNTANPNSSNYRGYGPFPISSNYGYSRLGTTGNIVNTWSREQELGVEMLSSKTWWNYPNYDFTDTTYSTGFARVDEQVNQFSMLTGYSKNQITNNWKSTVQLSGSNNSAQNNTLSSNDILYNPAFDLLWQNDFKINNDKFQFIAERKMQYAKMENSPVQTYGCSVDCLVNKYRVDDSVSTSYQARRGNNLANISIRTDQITGYNNQTTWSSAYGYLWTEQLRTNISYGTGFRAPSFNDLFYPGYGTSTLRPETNKNLEGAIRYESSQLNSQLSIYRNEIKNFILPVNCDGTITCPNYAYSGAFPLNVSDVMIKGLSLSADKKIGNLVFKGSADAMSTIDQTTGLDVPNRSKWAANGSIDYKIGYISFGSSITLSGNRWGAVTYNPSGNYNYQYMPSYTIVNLHASYQINKNLSAFGRANNIFDSQYQTSYGYSNGGTNVFMGLMYSL